MIQLPIGARLAGKAPPRCKVRLVTVGSTIAPDFQAEADADDQGAFAFPHSLAADRYLVFACQKTEAGYVQWYEARPRLEAGDERHVELRPGGTGGLRGRPGGHWRKGRFRLPGKGPWVEVPLTDGAYEVRGLPSGRYDVHWFGVVEVVEGRVTEALSKR